MASPEKTCEYVHLKLGFKLKSISSWRGYDEVWNHPQPSTKNKPQPPTTIRNHVCNHPQTPTTIQNHPQIPQKPPTTTQKLRKKDKTFLILKQMLTLIVIWNNGIYTWVCMYRHYIYYFFVTLIVCFCQQSNSFAIKSDERCGFKNFHLFHFHSKLPSDVRWL